RLMQLRFDVAGQQGIEQYLCVGLVDIVPVMLHLGVAFGQQRQQLLHVRRLRHGVDEFVTDQIKAIDTAFGIGIEHHLDAADEIDHRRCFANIANCRDHIAANTLEEARSLAADQAQIVVDALVSPFLHRTDGRLEQVDVQAAGQTAIGRYDDVADAFDFALAHELVLVLGVGIGDMANYRANTLRIRFADAHALLRLAHFARRHHFHCTGDLLRAFDAGYLCADLFGAGHEASSTFCVNNTGKTNETAFVPRRYRSITSDTGAESITRSASP